jgi:hypothetical protein
LVRVRLFDYQHCLHYHQNHLKQIAEWQADSHRHGRHAVPAARWARLVGLMVVRRGQLQQHGLTRDPLVQVRLVLCQHCLHYRQNHLKLIAEWQADSHRHGLTHDPTTQVRLYHYRHCQHYRRNHPRLTVVSAAYWARLTGLMVVQRGQLQRRELRRDALVQVRLFQCQHCLHYRQNHLKLTAE